MDDDTHRSHREFYTPGDQEGDTVRILPEDAARAGSARLDAYVPRVSAPPPPAPPEGSPEPAAPQPPVERVVKVRRGPTTCAILGVTMGLLALSCMLLAYAAMQNGLGGLGRLGGLVPGISFQFSSTPTVVVDTSLPTVVDRVRALSRLETVHYQVEKVISGTSTTGSVLPPPLAGDRILLVAHGEVIGGVDLTKLKPEDVVQTGDAVTMTIPPAEILSSKLDNDKTHVYDRQTGFFSKPDPNLESQLRSTAEREIVQAAREDGILQQAQQNAQLTLRTLLAGLGFKQIVFKEEP